MPEVGLFQMPAGVRVFLRQQLTHKFNHSGYNCKGFLWDLRHLYGGLSTSPAKAGMDKHNRIW
jgi:hypothetical protein